MNTELSPVIEKLQKILALADNQAATEGEVQSALARAKEIAMKHGIDLMTMPCRDDAKSKVTLKVGTYKGLRPSNRYIHPYHNWIMRTLEEVFGVKFLFHTFWAGSHPFYGPIYVLGEETDVQMCFQLFPWLEKLFPKLFRKQRATGRLGNSQREQNGFYYGLFEGICATNRQVEVQVEDKETWALVVQSKQDLVNQELEKHKIRKKKKQRKQFDAYAMGIGTEEGKEIHLSQLPANATES